MAKYEHIEPGLLTFAQSEKTWVFRRMCSSPPVVKWAEEPTRVTPADQGVVTFDFAAPAQYAFARPPAPEDDPRHPQFSRVDERSVNVPNETICEESLDAIQRQTEILEQHLPTRLANIELTHWRKVTIQKGFPITAILGAAGPGHAQRELPARFLEILDHVGRIYAQFRRSGDMSPDPENTNAGAPVFVKGMSAKVVSAALFGASPVLSDLVAGSIHFSRATGLPESVAHAYGLATRTVPVYKMLPQYRFAGGYDYDIVAEAAGIEVRRRQVLMAPSGANRLLRPAYAALNSARRRIPGMWHPGGPDVVPLATKIFHYESDISGYDKSVTPELQDAVAFVWKKYLPDLELQIRFFRYMDTKPVITPSWMLIPGSATVVASIGGIHSGIKLTSEFGSFVNAAATLYALERCKIMNATSWPSQMDAVVYVFGDDGRCSTNKAVDPETWSESFAELGLKCEIVEGGVFLSRYTLPDLHSAPVAGRIVQQTLWNEKETFGPAALGIAYLGAMARMEGVERLPAVLQRAIWSAIRHSAWIAALPKQAGVVELKRFLMTDRSVAEEIKRALEETAGIEWYADKVRASDHSPTAAMEVALADKAFSELNAKMKTAEEVTDALANAVSQMSFAKRMRFAVEGFYAVGEGKKAGLSWLREAVDAAGSTGVTYASVTSIVTAEGD